MKQRCREPLGNSAMRQRHREFVWWPGTSGSTCGVADRIL